MVTDQLLRNPARMAEAFPSILVNDKEREAMLKSRLRLDEAREQSEFKGPINKVIFNDGSFTHVRRDSKRAKEFVDNGEALGVRKIENITTPSSAAMTDFLKASRKRKENVDGAGSATKGFIHGVSTIMGLVEAGARPPGDLSIRAAELIKVAEQTASGLGIGWRKRLGEWSSDHQREPFTTQRPGFVLNGGRIENEEAFRSAMEERYGTAIDNVASSMGFDIHGADQAMSSVLRRSILDLAYNYAAIQGQSARALSDKDVAIFMDIIGKDLDPQTLELNLSRLTDSAIQKYSELYADGVDAERVEMGRADVEGDPAETFRHSPEEIREAAGPLGMPFLRGTGSRLDPARNPNDPLSTTQKTQAQVEDVFTMVNSMVLQRGFNEYIGTINDEQRRRLSAALAEQNTTIEELMAVESALGNAPAQEAR